MAQEVDKEIEDEELTWEDKDILLGDLFQRDLRAVFFNGPRPIRFAMRPRYGKKSVLYKRRWIYIAGMMSFEPLNTIFGRNFHKLYQIRVISKIEKKRNSDICVLRRNFKREVRSTKPGAIFDISCAYFYRRSRVCG